MKKEQTDNSKIFCSNLSKYMFLRNNMSRADLSRDLNIPYTTINDWFKGINYPKIDKIELLAQYFNITKSDLIEDNSDTSYSTTKIKVYGKISAGIPIEMNEYVLGEIEIEKAMMRGGKEFFALKVNGNSMFPKFLNDDVVVVEVTSNCENGDNCIVAVGNEDATFKKVIKTSDSIILQPLNPEYEPIIFSKDEIKKIRIIGIVRELRRKV